MNRRKFVQGALGSATAASAGVTPAAKANPRSAAQRTGQSAPTSNRKRVLFLAIDGMDPAIVRRFENDLPNIRRIKKEGFSGRILPYVSCWGNIDFMSMLTGAAPGTQYRTVTPSGERPRHQQCVAETIWHVLEDEQRRSFLIDFPGAIPSERVAVIPGGRSTLARGAIYQPGKVAVGRQEDLETTGWPPGGGPRPGRQPTVIADPKPASGWSSLPPSKRPPLETTLALAGRRGPSIQWPALLVADGPDYDTVLVFAEKNGAELARLTVGAWSPWANVTVETGSGAKEGRVRFHLLELDSSGQRLQLLQSAVCSPAGFCEPVDLSQDLVKQLGPFWRGSAIPPNPSDPFWQVGEAEALEGLTWVADAAIASLDSWDWDFFLHKVSLVDTAMHQCLTPADPSYHRYDPEVAKRYDAVYRKAYIDLDQVFGRLLRALEKRNDTVLFIGSDHGGGVNNVVCDIDQRLRDAGLLAGEGFEIDWARTRAYTKRRRQGTEVFVNLKGREPEGIVAAEEYEAVQEAVIDALLDWRDPQSNKRAVAYALKLRDAALIGYWGAEAGDVQLAYNPGFVWGVNPDSSAMAPSRSPISNHGPQIVTASTGYSSMMGMVLAWGPGVARGVERDEQAAGPIPIAAVAPTVSRLLGCRLPHDCQLGPIQELLA